VKPTPKGWPRAASALYYEGGSAAIDWLARAFGFEVRLKIEGEGGKLAHSELVYGEAVFMIGDSRQEKQPHLAAPTELDGKNTQSIMVYVDDVEAHFSRAKAAGARITSGIETHDYGDEYWTDRGYACVDVGGHHWWFAERVRTGPKHA
jgi:uncharacterized glyoxalase superfamily protein PhnB